MGEGVEAVAVNSATAGLHLALEAVGVRPGDKVLVPTLTFTATAEVVRYLGAEVVLVDCDSTTLLIDLDDAERRVTPQVKAIVPVHFGGLALNDHALQSFARRHALRVVEDAAHAFPCRNDGGFVGTSRSDAVVFSFYANKTITTGEGGMLVTRSRDIAERCRTMRTHGISRDAFDRFRVTGANWEYDVVAPGFKYNLADIASAIGLVQLGKAEDLRRQREAIAMAYFEKLAGLPLVLPACAPAGWLHSWHLFPVQLAPTAPVDRDALITALAERSIGTSVHYKPLHRMSYWKEVGQEGSQSFPNAERYFRGCVSLPIFPGMTDADLEEVVAAMEHILG
jgi:dTDP-4-amino-4,6-dideoxygalactose transaminase